MDYQVVEKKIAVELLNFIENPKLCYDCYAMLPRSSNLHALLTKKSHFLFGARSTGKTSLIKAQLSTTASYINLLDTQIYLRLAAHPYELESITTQAGKKQ